ncbi:hypothetical protein HAX54_039370 [Datura stramonium]|uniref:Uncharacterized protein n=1 Tax=Datura stramonium TaxID=4076 RepID=A0ABS8VMY9_DATST|nr:hypothetical protein [Datura stramonium]
MISFVAKPRRNPSDDIFFYKRTYSSNPAGKCTNKEIESKDWATNTRSIKGEQESTWTEAEIDIDLKDIWPKNEEIPGATEAVTFIVLGLEPGAHVLAEP